MFSFILGEIRKLWRYLLGKTSEIHDLDLKDILLAKVILDIHRKKKHSEFVLVPLWSIKQIHAIDRENALSATEKRTKVLLEARDHLRQKREITRAVLAEYVPSISWIKVVREDENSYIAYEGNGRVLAMQNVFSPSDNMLVEVEEYHFRNPKKIIRRMNRVRKVNGLC